MVKILDRDPVMRSAVINEMTAIDLLDTLLHYALGESNFYQQCRFELETELRHRLADL